MLFLSYNLEITIGVHYIIMKALYITTNLRDQILYNQTPVYLIKNRFIYVFN